MDLVYLQEFTTFAEHVNVTEAARHLYLSKSALSKHLSALEQEMGAQLFTRGKAPVLTPAGCLLAMRCAELLDAYDRTRRAVAAAPSEGMMTAGGWLGEEGLQVFEAAS